MLTQGLDLQPEAEAVRLGAGEGREGGFQALEGESIGGAAFQGQPGFRRDDVERPRS
jgi:hypothetical protein